MLLASLFPYQPATAAETGATGYLVRVSTEVPPCPASGLHPLPGQGLRGRNLRVTRYRVNDLGVKCLEACQADARCQAFTYTVLGDRGSGRAVCALKTGVGPRYACAQCISGIKCTSAAARPKPSRCGRWLRRGHYRFNKGCALQGHNYRIIRPAPNDPQACVRACDADKRCRAFSHAGPGFRGSAQAVCALKSGVGREYACVQCVSGIRTAAGPTPPPPPPSCPPGSGWNPAQRRCVNQIR